MAIHRQPLFICRIVSAEWSDNNKRKKIYVEAAFPFATWKCFENWNLINLIGLHWMRLRECFMFIRNIWSAFYRPKMINDFCGLLSHTMSNNGVILSRYYPVINCIVESNGAVFFSFAKKNVHFQSILTNGVEITVKFPTQFPNCMQLFINSFLLFFFGFRLI